AQRDFGHQPGKGAVILAQDGRRLLRFGRRVRHLDVAVGVRGAGGDIHEGSFRRFRDRVHTLQRTVWRICSFSASAIRRSALPPPSEPGDGTSQPREAAAISTSPTGPPCSANWTAPATYFHRFRR